MDLELSPDHKLLQESVVRLLEQYGGPLPAGQVGYYQDGAIVADTLARNGYMDVVGEDGANLGLLGAFLVVEAACRLPQSVEVAGSALLAPLSGAGARPRPVAVATAPHGRIVGAPIRFLKGAMTVLVDCGDDIRAIDPTIGTTEDIAPSHFAYPYARFTELDLSRAQRLEIEPTKFRHLRRVALAAELAGALRATLDLTVAFVKDRTQFGRRLGSFQAIQHRLSECVTFVHGARIMALRAAVAGSAVDSEAALFMSQEAAARLAYDSQQFHGALGQTLEYPLHYWSFRLRALQGEMGGPWALAQSAATALWGPQPRSSLTPTATFD